MAKYKGKMTRYVYFLVGTSAVVFHEFNMCDFFAVFVVIEMLNLTSPHFYFAMQTRHFEINNANFLRKSTASFQTFSQQRRYALNSPAFVLRRSDFKAPNLKWLLPPLSIFACVLRAADIAPSAAATRTARPPTSCSRSI